MASQIKKKRMDKTENQMLIIFGASGDLTARKLIPALFHLYRGKHLPKNFVVLGVSRSNLTDEAFREKVVTGSSYLQNDLDGHADSFISEFSNKL